MVEPFLAFRLARGNDLSHLLLVPTRRHNDGALFVSRFDVLEGRVCAGVLGGGRWLVAPDGATAEYVFDSGSLEAVRVVLVNCNVRDAGNPASRFRLLGGSYGLIVAP